MSPDVRIMASVWLNCLQLFVIQFELLEMSKDYEVNRYQSYQSGRVLLILDNKRAKRASCRIVASNQICLVLLQAVRSFITVCQSTKHYSTYIFKKRRRFVFKRGEAFS